MKLTQNGSDAGNHGTKPTNYVQASYKASSKSVSVTSPGVNDIGSIVIMKYDVSPATAPYAIIGTVEIGYSNKDNSNVEATTDAWASPTAATGYWWDPQNEVFTKKGSLSISVADAN